jgi:hypothetical protein
MPQQHYYMKVDPQRIQFNPLNPRKHRGTEYVRLKESIEQIGIIQPPIVRVLPGNFFEAIDGEGRISIAQELGLEAIWVICVGIVDDQEALVMLQASNSLRSFTFLAECKGLANLYRRKISCKELAKQFGCSASKIADMVGVGHFPEQTLLTIEENIATSEKQAGVWTYFLFDQLLPLREVLPEKTIGRGSAWQSLDDLYNYSEVNTAIEKVIGGEITGGEQMRTYVVNRRYEIYQARFDQELQQKLEEKLAAAKQELEAAKERELREQEQEREQRVQAAEKQARQRYEGQITILQSQIVSLKKRQEEAAKDVAKYPNPDVIAAREREIDKEVEKTQKEIEKTQRERQELENLQQRLKMEAARDKARREEEARKKQVQWEKETREQMAQELSLQRERQRREHKEALERAEARMKEIYEQKGKDLEIKAENTIQGLLSHGIKQLAEAQQVLDHIVSTSMIGSVHQQGGAQYENLLWAIRSMSEALHRAEEKLTYGDVTYVEGGKVNGHQ